MIVAVYRSIPCAAVLFNNGALDACGNVGQENLHCSVSLIRRWPEQHATGG